MVGNWQSTFWTHIFYSKASNVLGEMFLEQRHKRQREELEYEMKLELEKSKEELNRQLEVELNAELQVRK